MIDDHVRENMRKLLAEIQDGTFAREWIAEMERGERNLDELRAAAREQQIEQVGLELPLADDAQRARSRPRLSLTDSALTETRTTVRPIRPSATAPR